MRKSLRQVLDWLRTGGNGKLRKRTSVRGGVQEPQQMRAPLGSVQIRPQR
jgi:hypothetical protein